MFYISFFKVFIFSILQQTPTGAGLVGGWWPGGRLSVVAWAAGGWAAGGLSTLWPTGGGHGRPAEARQAQASKTKLKKTDFF